MCVKAYQPSVKKMMRELSFHISCYNNKSNEKLFFHSFFFLFLRSFFSIYEWGATKFSFKQQWLFIFTKKKTEHVYFYSFTLFLCEKKCLDRIIMTMLVFSIFFFLCLYLLPLPCALLSFCLSISRLMDFLSLIFNQGAAESEF